MTKTTATATCQECKRDMPVRETKRVGNNPRMKWTFCKDKAACSAYLQAQRDAAAANAPKAECKRCHRSVPQTAMITYRQTCDRDHKSECDAAFRANREAEEAKRAAEYAAMRERWDAEDAAWDAIPVDTSITHVAYNGINGIICGVEGNAHAVSMAGYISRRDDAADKTDWCADCLAKGARTIASEEAQLNAKPLYIPAPAGVSGDYGDGIRGFATSSTGGDWADEE